MLIAVVDDEEQVRRSMERLLRSAGYDVVSFAGGAAFVGSLGETRPECVLLDWQMPGVDGAQVLFRLSGYTPRIPAIVVSGHGTAEVRRAAIALGAAAFLPKPFDPAALLRAVAVAVAVATAR
jgi:two-component system response regulator FixJ